MSQSEKQLLLEQINIAIEKGIDYLSQHQFPNGEFVCYMALDEYLQDQCAPESNNYTTILIAHCLLHFQDMPKVDNILNKATASLKYQMMRSGVWNYLTKFHLFFKYNPPDVDDTALASDLLRKRNITIPYNKDILLCNRSHEGLFYTWFTWHKTFLRFSKQYYRLIARELKYPISNLLYWRTSKYVKRGDIDAVINANVISYLGESDDTTPAINYILSVIKQDKELKSDNYYQNIFVIFYFISRLVVINIKPLVDVTDILIKKILEAMKNSKRLLVCDMELSLSLSSLLMLGYKGEEIHLCAKTLLDLQANTGEWKRFSFYSVNAGMYWGCEELTTALCCEALHLYSQTLNDNK